MDKRCVDGKNPDAIYTGNLSGDEEFWDAPDLSSLGHQLVRQKIPNFPDGVSVSYLWKFKGGAPGGKAKLGYCKKVSGELQHFAASDYLIVLSADWVRDFHFTNWQLEALLYHELLHVQAEETERGVKLGTRPHDIEAFREEVSEYGFWRSDLVSFAQTIQRQLSFEDAMSMSTAAFQALPEEDPDDLPVISNDSFPDAVLEEVAAAVNSGALDTDEAKVTVEVTGGRRGRR